MRIGDVTSTMLFAGTAARPRQIVQVTIAGDGDGDGDGTGPVTVSISGAGVSTPEPATVTGPAPGAERVAEVGIELAAPAAPGSARPVTVIADGGASRAERRADLTKRSGRGGRSGRPDQPA